MKHMSARWTHYDNVMGRMQHIQHIYKASCARAAQAYMSPCQLNVLVHITDI